MTIRNWRERGWERGSEAKASYFMLIVCIYLHYSSLKIRYIDQINRLHGLLYRNGGENEGIIKSAKKRVEMKQPTAQRWKRASKSRYSNSIWIQSGAPDNGTVYFIPSEFNVRECRPNKVRWVGREGKSTCSFSWRKPIQDHDIVRVCAFDSSTHYTGGAAWMIRHTASAKACSGFLESNGKCKLQEGPNAPKPLPFLPKKTTI